MLDPDLITSFQQLLISLDPTDLNRLSSLVQTEINSRVPTPTPLKKPRPKGNLKELALFLLQP